MSVEQIQLRGVEVHNLKRVDLDIPRHKLVVVCGVSGSGKSSLALDTLYAEGQRRYIESFSAYARQFLERLEKPAAERIDGIPAAIAITRKFASHSSRSTIGTTTEIADFLSLLFAKVAVIHCPRCGRRIQRDTASSAAALLDEFPAGTRLMLAFSRQWSSPDELERQVAELREDGFVRLLLGDRLMNIASEPLAADRFAASDSPLYVVVDRVSSGGSRQRLRESLETAFAKGAGRCFAFVADGTNGQQQARRPANGKLQIEGNCWSRIAFSLSLGCADCGGEFPRPEPRLFSFNSPLGACPECQGFGNVIEVDMDLVVPDPSKSLRDGAIAPWNTPAYAHELEELLELADDYDLPVDIPFRELSAEQLALVRRGVPERSFGGLDGFFAWLERRKYKMHLRVFLSRWRSYRSCPSCRGARLRNEALAATIAGKNIADVSRLKISEAHEFFQTLESSEHDRTVARVVLEQIEARLRFLIQVGVEYLTLDRTLRTLSGGEAQRVALTSALASNLVDMLYVLDEPSVGLHPRDVRRLIDAITGLRDRGNSVVVVEHEESMLRAADQLVEIGPGAGRDGGEVVFQGSVAEMCQSKRSLTGEYLSRRRGISTPARRRPVDHGFIRLAGARGNNLRNITVDFPLGVLCLVTGVSGSGKSTLVQDTLYPAICLRKRKEAGKPCPYDDVFGDGQVDDVILVDQNPIGRSPRSNPVTYIKAFDEIRSVFADTIEARTHNYSAGHFSFNVDGGRCSKCRGDGYIAIDMQFLADVYRRCDECGGTRYREEILDVTYRNRNIADVLEMTVREAFSFFRGQTKVQAKLKRLLDVGLDYLRLGQPANTLSAGEAQRLKLAVYMSAATRNRTLFILDEPTTGLHFNDVVQLLDCFDALLNVGHSLIVVEHNLQMMKAADYLIDLGPGAAEHGGSVVAQGTPEQLAEQPTTATGHHLAEVLDPRPTEQLA